MAGKQKPLVVVVFEHNSNSDENVVEVYATEKRHFAAVLRSPTTTPKSQRSSKPLPEAIMRRAWTSSSRSARTVPTTASTPTSGT